MVSINGFKKYARLMPDEDTETAELCLAAAKQHAHDAGIPDSLDTDGDAKYALYIYALAAHYYDNRAMMPSSQAYAVDEYTQRMMTKFRVELAARVYDDGV
jgi:uncharacterized phage protein (predicted DNA packaging)